MVLVALAVVGGGAYLLRRHHKQKKQRKLAMINGQYLPEQHHANRAAEDFHNDFNAPQQYYNTSEKQPPVYRDQPTATNEYPNEKGGVQQSMQEIKN